MVLQVQTGVTTSCRICAGERLSNILNILILGLARHAWLIWCARHSKTQAWLEITEALKQPQLFWQWKLSNMTPARNSISIMQAGFPSLATCMFIRIITQFLEKKTTHAQPSPNHIRPQALVFGSKKTWPASNRNFGKSLHNIHNIHNAGCISRRWSCFRWFAAMEDLEGYRQAQAAEWHQVRGVLVVCWWWHAPMGEALALTTVITSFLKCVWIFLNNYRRCCCKKHGCRC